VAEPAAESAVDSAAESVHAVVRLADISAQPLSVDAVMAAVADPRVGGIGLFVGTVRLDDGGRSVESLEYEAHPEALTVMRDVAADVAARHDAISVACVHRVGLLAVGDLAVVVAAGCGHRGEAMATARELIDEVKARVPIWKRQTFTDGSVEWVGAEGAPV
jgi:molybdopterin synthase catalytic subunit